jgi:ATP-dependent Lhr-like helicase
VPVLRRLEVRGEIRGGRFVNGPFGEQYALPDVVNSLRKARAQQSGRANEPALAVAGADPLNLAGILVPGERVAAVPGQTVAFVNGVVRQEETAMTMSMEPRRRVSRSRSLAELLRAEAMPLRAAQQPVSQDLFS